MSSSPIIIAGGGIAGLAAALALKGREGLILEQAPAFSHVGAGLQLGPNAVRALQKLGAWDAVIPHTSQPRELHMRDGLSGKLLKRLKLTGEFEARYGASYHVAHRAGLHEGLIEVVRSKPNLRIKLGKPLEHVEAGTNGVTATLAGRNLAAPALIATDGVQSRLRQSLFPHATAIDSRETLHRALLPLQQVAAFELDCVTLWMLPHGHAVHYCVGKTPQLNLVVITPHGIAPMTMCVHATRDLRALIQTAAPHFTQWPGFYVQPLSQWVKELVLLLGDAAHGTLPYLAQGAAMSLEDAACLAEVLPTTQSLRHAFAETAVRRKARTMRLHCETLSTGKLYHYSGIMRHLRNLAISSTPETLVHLKVNWLYRNTVETQSNVKFQA